MGVGVHARQAHAFPVDEQRGRGVHAPHLAYLVGACDTLEVTAVAHARSKVAGIDTCLISDIGDHRTGILLHVPARLAGEQEVVHRPVEPLLVRAALGKRGRDRVGEGAENEVVRNPSDRGARRLYVVLPDQLPGEAREGRAGGTGGIVVLLDRDGGRLRAEADSGSGIRFRLGKHFRQLGGRRRRARSALSPTQQEPARADDHDRDQAASEQPVRPRRRAHPLCRLGCRLLCHLSTSPGPGSPCVIVSVAGQSNPRANQASAATTKNVTMARIVNREPSDKRRPRRAVRPRRAGISRSDQRAAISMSTAPPAAP